MQNGTAYPMVDNNAMLLTKTTTSNISSDEDGGAASLELSKYPITLAPKTWCVSEAVQTSAKSSRLTVPYLHESPEQATRLVEDIL